MNNVKTFILMAGLMALFLVVGQAIGGQQGLLMALVMGSAMNFIMYFFSDKMVLKMYGAKVITRRSKIRPSCQTMIFVSEKGFTRIRM